MLQLFVFPLLLQGELFRRSQSTWTHYRCGCFDFGSIRKTQSQIECFAFLDCPLKGHQHDVVAARLHLEAAPGGNFDRTRGRHFHNGTVFDGFMRSEEHTSELQSLMRISYAVFCLKKKNNTYK